MAVWDLNSKLDVFGMQILNNFPIGSNVKTMSADGGHFEPRSGSLNTNLEVEPLRTIEHGMDGPWVVYFQKCVR
jgi:hypothetical protein